MIDINNYGLISDEKRNKKNEFISLKSQKIFIEFMTRSILELGLKI